MALHPDFPKSPYEILDPSRRWVPTRERLREINPVELIPPLVDRLRGKVKEFRDGNYAGAANTSKRLLEWWFEIEHLQPGADGVPTPFRYYFAQREAVETIIWLADVAGARDKFDLLRYDSSGAVSHDMFDEHWCRYVIKMATGSGKTKVMSLALAWSYFHKLYEPDSPMARNFLVIAPNIIVLDRLARDFEGLRIFHEDPVLPEDGFGDRNWRSDFNLTLHRQDELRTISRTGNIFLTNIHRVYDGDTAPASATDENTKDYFLGAKVTGETTDSGVELDRLLRDDIDELMVVNDEAHHVHDRNLAWFKSIEDIHNRLVRKGSELSLQLDLTATPRHENGAVFVQTVSDYPLVEAIAQDIVKHPVVPDNASQLELRERVSDKFTEKYADFIELGVIEWRKVYKEQIKNGRKSILFVMVDDTRNCDEVAEYLRGRYPDFEAEDSVLTIHTKQNGEISETASGKNQRELTKLRSLANEIDKPDNPYKAIVSVLMLREGWDVRNVTTIIGLRAFAARSNILPEQTLGRGLRRMYPEHAGEHEETVSVIGTPAFMEFVESIREEGVTLEAREMGGNTPALSPLVIEIDHENIEKDINGLDMDLPILMPHIYREYGNLEELAPADLLDKPLELKTFSAEQQREINFIYTVVQEAAPDHHHKTRLDMTGIIDYRSVTGYFARIIKQELRLVDGYDILYEKVRDLMENHLFGGKVDLQDAAVLRNLSEQETIVTIVNSFKDAVNKLTLRNRDGVEINCTLKLSRTRPFVVKWQEYLKPKKSVFNRIVGDSHLELMFADFLEGCPDVVSYAKNYPAVHFKLDYINADGNISNYRPDFFVKTKDGGLTLVETKGLEDLDVPLKMARLKQWCEDVAATDWPVKPRFVFVDQQGFERDRGRLQSFEQIINSFRKYQ